MNSNIACTVYIPDDGLSLIAHILRRLYELQRSVYSLKIMKLGKCPYKLELIVLYNLLIIGISLFEEQIIRCVYI